MRDAVAIAFINRTSTSIKTGFYIIVKMVSYVLPNSCKKSRQSGTFGWFPYNQLFHRFQFYPDS